MYTYVIKIDGVDYTQESLDALPNPIVCSSINGIDGRKCIVKQQFIFKPKAMFPNPDKDLSWWGIDILSQSD